MEVKAGYKQTEVGDIPANWGVDSICSIGHVIRGSSPRPKGDSRFYGGDIPRLMVEDVTRDRKYVTPTIDTLTLEGAKLSRPCKKGTLTVVCSGTPTVVGLPSILAVDACIHDGMLGLTHLNKSVEPEYLFYRLTDLQEQLHAAATHGGTFVNLTTKGFGAFRIAVPPPNEQRAIATALSDVDELLNGIDRLIAKKRNLKRAAMQQLLTGQTRLKGFGPTRARKSYEYGSIPDDWDVRPLRIVSSMNGRIGWQGLKLNEFTENSNDPFLITGMNFKDGKIRWEEVYHIPRHRYEEAPAIQLHVDDILMTKDGTIGKLLYVDTIPHPGLASLNSHLLVFRPIAEQFVPRFLFYQLNSPAFAQHIELHKSGSTFFGLTQTATGKYPAVLPSVSEQVAISEALAAIDRELDTLEVRREKTSNLKQGMMQELLTGRTRLI